MASVALDKPKSLMRRPAVVKILILALLAEIGYAVLNISTMPVYLQQERGWGEFGISFVLVAFLLSEAVFKGPMGSLADRYGCRKLLIIAPLLTFATSLLTLAVPHSQGKEGWLAPGWVETSSFVLLRVIDGIGAAALWPAAFALMSHSVEDRERQQAMSLLNMMYFLGIALALPLGGIAEDYFRAKSAGLFLAAGAFAAVFLAVWRLIPPDDPNDTHVQDAEGFQIRKFLASLRQIPQYLILAVVTFMGIGFPMAVVKLFARDEFNMTSTAFGALVMPGAIALALFSVPMSRYGERIGRVKAVHVGMGMCALGLIVVSMGGFIPFLRSPWVLALGGIPIGLGFLLAIPAWLTAVSDLDPRNRGTNLGAVMTAQGLGAILGAPLGGLAYEMVGPWAMRLGVPTSQAETLSHYSPFIGCAACITIGWLVGLRILREGR